ncbi:MAG TPA: hypothetical protein DEA82_12010, partial [Flavobacteriaceae bacterium]|nr:hypothetical protein [Flavobacteriaceae bacterium]
MEKDMKTVQLLVSSAGKNRYIKPTRTLIQRAIAISEAADDNEMRANSYYSMGNYHYFNAKLDSASYMLDKALTYISDDELPFIRSGILATKGGISSQNDAVSQSIVYTMQAREILDKLDTIELNEAQKKKRRGQSFVLANSLANLYNKVEDFETSLVYYDIANEAALKMGDLNAAGVIISNKGNLLLKMDRKKAALNAFNEGKELKVKAGAPTTSIAISNLNIGAAHLELNQEEEALSYLNSALSIFEERNYTSGIAEVLPQRGALYNKQAKYDLAIADCEKAKRLIDAIKVPELMSAACECLYEAYKSKGDFKSALDNYERFTIARDSVINEKNIKRLTQIEMQY